MALLQKYADSCKSLVVTYGTATYSDKADIFQTSIAEHTHEEADTLIPLHVLDALSKSNGSVRDIDIYSPDTDVFILLMDLVLLSWKIKFHYRKRGDSSDN